jgi:catechol 2,3-dioxygenase-like lactoylglutathione lyase family enzyme
MKITGVDHVQIAVPPQLETAALEFYGRVLGLRRLPKPEGTDDTRGAWLDGGNVQVHIGVQSTGFQPATKAHVGFIVADLAKAQAELERCKVTTKPAGNLPGFKRFFAQDPAGNRIEFLQSLV